MVPARHEGVQALALQSRDVALEASKDALIVRVAHGLQLRLADMGQRFLHFRTAIFLQAVGVLTQAVDNLLVANAILLNVGLARGSEAPIWREPAHWLEAHLLQDLVRKPMFFLTPS